MFAQLSTADVQHFPVEGDNLDQAYPTPWQQGLKLAELNLAAIWRNYRAAGYHRLVHTNTASFEVIDELTRAMSDQPRVTAVLLGADDATARARLGQREIGSALAQHVERSRQASKELDQRAPSWVHRIATDDRSVVEIVAAELIALTGWLGAGAPELTQRLLGDPVTPRAAAPYCRGL